MNISSFRKWTQIYITTAILVLITCLGIAMYLVGRYAEQDCLDHMQENTVHVATTVRDKVVEARREVFLFTNVLADDVFMRDKQLENTLAEFCTQKKFTGVKILRQNDSVVSAGRTPSLELDPLSFEKELLKVSYITEILVDGAKRNEQYIRVAAPIVKNRVTIGIIYGYINLDDLAGYMLSTDYDGKTQYFLVDTNTGKFLVNEYHRTNRHNKEIPLENAFNVLEDLQAADGMNWLQMRHDLDVGRPGYRIYLSQISKERIYSYYMPVGINNWALIGSIDEKSAFAYFLRIRNVFFMLTAMIIAASLFIVFMLMALNHKEMKREMEHHQESERVSLTDYLTGAGNRRALYAYTGKLTLGEQVGVIYCDLTGLKHANDTQGHAAGDMLLLKTVQGMRAAFNKEQIFRVGGDEFLIVCPNTTEAEMLQKTNVMQEYWTRVSVVVACGQAWTENYSGNPDALFTSAEQNMYAAKTEWYRNSNVERRRR